MEIYFLICSLSDEQPIDQCSCSCTSWGRGVLAGARPDMNVTATIFFIIFKSLVITYIRCSLCSFN